MSAFSDLMEQGFRTMVRMGGGTFIRANGVEKPCVANGIEKRLRMTNSSLEYFGPVPPVCEMLLADFDALKLKPGGRAEILLTPRGQPEKTVELALVAVSSGAEDDYVHLVFQMEDPRTGTI